MKPVHSLSRRRGEGNVKTCARREHATALQFQTQPVLALSQAVTDGCFIFKYALETECSKSGVIERAGQREIGNAEGEVMQHVGAWSTAPHHRRGLFLRPQEACGQAPGAPWRAKVVSIG